MQTPRKSASRNGSSDLPKKTSPNTPRSRQTNMSGSASDSTAPASPGVKTSISRSPKFSEHRSPRSSTAEVSHLREDLKKAKDQLASAESTKKRAEKEVQDANKKFMLATKTLKDVELQLHELSESEDARILELRKVGLERDKAWQAELEAVQKQRSADSAALLSSKNEIQRLKQQLETATSSEAAQGMQLELAKSQLLALQQSTAEAMLSVDSLKMQLQESEKIEEQQQLLLTETQLQLEMAKVTIDALQVDGVKALKSSDAMATELADSKSRISYLEEVVRKLEANDRVMKCGSTTPDAESLRTKLTSLHSEIEQLRGALEVAEVNYQEEQIKCTMLFHSAYEVAERTKMDRDHIESKWELMLRESQNEVSELKSKLINQEMELYEKDNLDERVNAETINRQEGQAETDTETKLCSLTADVSDLKAKLVDKETELQIVLEENELLMLELEKKEAERIKSIETANAEVEIARSAEQEALVSVGIVTEESEKTTMMATRVCDQLQVAQAANSEMESELKRLRVQTEQWRKAAEAAAAILTTGNNGRLVERTGSLDGNYSSIAGKLVSSPFSDVDVDSPKKKNNVLKKFGVLWKKNPR